MPFKSKKQMGYLFAEKPEVAQKFVEHAKAAGEPVIQKPDKDLKQRLLGLGKKAK